VAALALCAIGSLVSCAGPRHTASIKRNTAGAHGLLPAGVVAQVGSTRITRSTYDHWMRIGAATVEMPVPGRPLPQPIAYRPPKFTACVDHLRARTAKSTPTATLRARCRATYKSIHARILNFLITGFWLRGQAAEQGVSVSEAEVRRTLDEERHRYYPSAASFGILLQASHQTISDLMFALETQTLSAKLLEKFTRAQHRRLSEQQTIAGFNRAIRTSWIPRTICAPGYVVSDCSDYNR
jgi:hypothetical protein